MNRTFSLIGALCIAIQSPSLAAANEGLTESRAQLIAETSKLTVSLLEQREDERLEKIPNPLDCKVLSWLGDCHEINKQAKLNPNAPIRVINKQGVEFNFVPGTPSAYITHQLSLTEQSADALLDYIDATNALNKKAASLVKDRMMARGGLSSTLTLDEYELMKSKPLDINHNAVRLSLFATTTCPWCTQIVKNLKKLKAKHPNAQISIYLMDSEPEGYKEMFSDNVLSVRKLNQSELKQIIKQGVTQWPTIWLDNTETKSRRVLVGVKTANQLEELLFSHSKLEVSQ